MPGTVKMNCKVTHSEEKLLMEITPFFSLKRDLRQLMLKHFCWKMRNSGSIGRAKQNRKKYLVIYCLLADLFYFLLLKGVVHDKYFKL